MCFLKTSPQSPKVAISLAASFPKSGLDLCGENRLIRAVQKRDSCTISEHMTGSLALP